MGKKPKQKKINIVEIVYTVETYLVAKGGKKKGEQIMLTFTEMPLK